MTMDRIAKNRWQVRLAALVIFLLGAAAGALALNVYHSWSRAAEHGGPGRGGFERKMLERLELNAEQEPRVREILADARREMQEARSANEPRMDDIRRRTDERLQQVLTPEQWQRFQQMKQDMRGRRRGKREESRQ